MNSSSTTPSTSRVLARKYRPQNFAELIGQDALVRTLRNAFTYQRIAQAYMLTGVRGVGKTTTARVIAKALNCQAPAEQRPHPADPCGTCESCVSIAQDRHVDIMEMDAASHTGVDDVREILEGVRYRPVSGQYKVYIIDEVHMLSKQAFNALLKTLEEPPPHVKFIFATTEIRKVPVTILSRCQRFDLKRVSAPTLGNHFKTIAEYEGYTIADGALRILVRASDGSVRDGLSLLDQAMTYATAASYESNPSPIIEETHMIDMLGLADRSKVFDLFDSLQQGNIQQTLIQYRSLYESGVDALTLIQDLMEVVQKICLLKIHENQENTNNLQQEMLESEWTRFQTWAKNLGIPSLTLYWQVLKKGIQDIQTSMDHLADFEMLLIRMGYMAQLPTPFDVIESLRAAGNLDDGLSHGNSIGAAPKHLTSIRLPSSSDSTQVLTSPVVPESSNPHERINITCFEDLIELCEQKREPMLKSALCRDVHLVSFSPGQICIRLGEHAHAQLVSKIRELVDLHAAGTWTIETTDETGSPTLYEQEQEQIVKEKETISSLPVVKQVLELFPGAEIEAYQKRTPESSKTEY